MDWTIGFVHACNCTETIPAPAAACETGFAMRPEMEMDKDSPPPPAAPDGAVVFIGRIRTPWPGRKDCPHNVLRAREAGGTATVEIAPAYRAGLDGLSAFSHVVLLYWMDEAERDVMIQTPRHSGRPRGVFSIRSPARPNPIALSVARLIAIDEAAGLLTVEQLDCRDGTPLLDVKPYLPSIDAVPDARTDRG
jgi:tRNA-Thr(GGU) m(6)t(6)A37 methyltransferase TsaA